MFDIARKCRTFRPKKFSCDGCAQNFRPSVFVRLQPNKQGYDVPVCGDWLTVAVVAERGKMKYTQAPAAVSRDDKAQKGDDEDRMDALPELDPSAPTKAGPSRPFQKRQKPTDEGTKPRDLDIITIRGIRTPWTGNTTRYARVALEKGAIRTRKERLETVIIVTNQVTSQGTVRRLRKRCNAHSSIRCNGRQSLQYSSV